MSAGLHVRVEKARRYDDWDHLVQYLHRAHGGESALDKLRDALVWKPGLDELGARHWASLKEREASSDSAWPPYKAALEWATVHFKFTLADLTAALPEHHQFGSNHTFVGRTAYLQQLDELLDSDGRVCLTSIALRGIGGMGKTAIANHYARTRRSKYSAILWIDARRDLESQIIGFASGISGVTLKGDGSFEQRMSEVFGQLASKLRRQLLVVFDDVPANSQSEDRQSPREEQIEKILGALPQAQAWRYHFLLTSRHQPRITRVKPVNVERMSSEDAVALFLERTGYKRTQVDVPALQTLVNEVLGGHPLSITLLAAYAHKKRTKNIELLLAVVRRQIVDATELGDVVLPEYGNGIRATFEISFNELTRSAQLLLLLLAMFRRDVIGLPTIKACARLMSSHVQTEAVRELHDELTGKGGRAKSARLLTRLALLEQVARPRRSKSEVRNVQLHEVIYDFAQAQWSRLRRQPEWAGVLADLELAFTRGAISYASSAIQASVIEFQDVDSLTGLLLPRVRVERGFVPSLARINESLTFWYEYFMFQNFVYDTGLQDALLEQMIELRGYLETEQLLSDRFGLILDKLIGHAYYADPGRTGDLARTYFDRALKVAAALDEQKPVAEGQIPIARWYWIFLLDHRSNVASKGRAALSPIWHDKSFAQDFADIERMLPANLRSLAGVPSEEECELLLRAAHYWGHRGNQDAFTLHQRFISQDAAGVDDGVAQSAINSYVLAANYRLLGLRIFRTGQFNRYLRSPVSKGQVPLLVPWINEVLSLQPQKRFESFTSVAQGVGDAAHQYRGLHFVYVLQFLTATDSAARRELRGRAESAFKCAKLLWEIAEGARREDEVPLRYKLWMASSGLLMNLVNEMAADRPPPDFKLDQLREAIADTQKTMRTPYHYSANEQEKQLQGIWSRLRGRDGQPSLDRH